jgi:hypothetical protein
VSSSDGNPSAASTGDRSSNRFTTAIRGITRQPPLRIASSIPQPRKISIERVLTPVARGKIDVVGWRSTRIERTPWRARPMAVTSPAGPAPTISTGMLVTAGPSAALVVVSMVSMVVAPLFGRTMCPVSGHTVR